MSDPTKLRAGAGELTKLKEVWRRMADDARDYWRERFVSSELTQAQIRQELRTKLMVSLKYDSALNAFRDWELQQRKLDLAAEEMEEDQRRALAENPDWTLDQARETVLKKAYQRASVQGDFKLGLATIVQDLNAKKVGMDARKLALMEKKALAFDQAKEVVESKLTPEEQRLRLREILK